MTFCRSFLVAPSLARGVPGDLNLHGVVNFSDCLIVADNFGKSGPAELDTIYVERSFSSVASNRPSMFVCRYTPSIVEYKNALQPHFSTRTDHLETRHSMVLSPEYIESYCEDGYTIVSNLIPEENIDRAVTCLWTRLGMNPDQPDSWKQPPTPPPAKAAWHLTASPERIEHLGLTDAALLACNRISGGDKSPCRLCPRRFLLPARISRSRLVDEPISLPG